MRAIAAGKRFHKVNDPHVVYFQNPEGISTRPDSRGLEESRKILRRYSRQLVAPELLADRQSFGRLLSAGEAGPPLGGPQQTYYELVQDRLRRIAAGRDAGLPRDLSSKGDDRGEAA